MKIPFKKGIKWITNKKRHSDALYAFERFLEEEHKSFGGKYRDPATRKKEIDKLIAAYERDGFTLEEIAILRAKYQSQKRRKPRKRPKKEFDAKGLPKMPKTPENQELMREFIRIRQRSLTEK